MTSAAVVPLFSKQFLRVVTKKYHTWACVWLFHSYFCFVLFCFATMEQAKRYFLRQQSCCLWCWAGSPINYWMFPAGLFCSAPELHSSRVTWYFATYRHAFLLCTNSWICDPQISIPSFASEFLFHPPSFIKLLFIMHHQRAIQWGQSCIWVNE